MASAQVDGNDIMAVREVVAAAAKRARSGEGPTLVEAVTWRHRGHSMADADVQRDKAQQAEWRKRDPIHRFAEDVLFKAGAATPQDLEEIAGEAEIIVEKAVAFAESSPEPALDTLYNNIYMEPVSNMQTGGSLIRPPQLAGRSPADANGSNGSNGNGRH